MQKQRQKHGPNVRLPGDHVRREGLRVGQEGTGFSLARLDPYKYDFNVPSSVTKARKISVGSS